MIVDLDPLHFLKVKFEPLKSHTYCVFEILNQCPLLGVNFSVVRFTEPLVVTIQDVRLYIHVQSFLQSFFVLNVQS